MPPGTISGVDNPDDRLREEGGRGRFLMGDPGVDRPGADAPPHQDSLAARGILFLIACIAGCVFALLVLRRPLADALAWVLSALGIPVVGPSAGGDGWARAAVRDPWAFFVSLTAAQLVFLAFAIIGARLLGGSFRDRLGLVMPRGGWRVLGVAAVIEVLVFAFGACAVMTFLPSGQEPPARNVALIEMLQAAPLGAWLACLAAMAVLAPIGEEALFRGLIQRQLLRWWTPSAAILCTGLVFTIGHPPLVRALMLLPGCIFLGYVAYRCGSILPGMILHALTNGGIHVLVRLTPDMATAEAEPVRWVSALVALGTGAAAGWLLVLVHRWTRPPEPPPREQAAPEAPAQNFAV